MMDSGLRQNDSWGRREGASAPSRCVYPLFMMKNQLTKHQKEPRWHFNRKRKPPGF
jgi:hypothetical protein